MQDFGITADKSSVMYRTRYPTENIHQTFRDIFIAGTKEEQRQLSKEMQEDIQVFERELRNDRKQKSLTGQER